MKVHELLNSEDKWCKHAFAKNSGNKPTWPIKEDAIRWCAGGALIKCYDNIRLMKEAEVKLTNYLRQSISLDECPFSVISYWNDKSDYQTVYKTLKELDI